MWDAPSLCEGWRTREVVAHVTMPARYDGPAFMVELDAAGGDFTRLSNTVAARDAALPVATLLADLRSRVLHAWEPPGGGARRRHAPIASSTSSTSSRRVPLGRRIPGETVRAVLELVAAEGSPNLFGVDLRDVELRADDLDWSSGTGDVVSGAGAGAGAGGVWPPTATGPSARGGGAPLHPILKGCASWRAMRRAGATGPAPGAACSTGTGRPARPVGQGARAPDSGTGPCPARTSHAVSTMPRFTSWRPSTAWWSRW